MSAALIVPTYVGGWAPLLHWVCVNGQLVSHQVDRWIPSVFVNSPYGGEATGMGMMAWDFPGAWNGPPPPPGHTFKWGWGTNASNGKAGTIFFIVNASLYRVHNSTAWGPGANDRCKVPYAVDLESPTRYGGLSDAIPTPSDLSDAGEVDNISIVNTPANLSTVVYFNNSFTTPNAQSVTTCGSSTQILPFESNFLVIGIPFGVDNRTIIMPFTLPFTESFNYTFPADLGTWQIDNLAAGADAPGGGLAFSFVACPP